MTKRLLLKLKAYGIQGKVMAWITSFLTDRKMTVMVMGKSSLECAVQSGVPQGSVIGPVLFILYVNNIPAAINNHIKLFADDTKI